MQLLFLCIHSHRKVVVSFVLASIIYQKETNVIHSTTQLVAELGPSQLQFVFDNGIILDSKYSN